MARRAAAGFDVGSVVDDASVPCTVDDEPVGVAPEEPGEDEPPPEEDLDEALRPRRAAAAPSSAQRLRDLIERVPAAPAGTPSPRSGSAFRVVDSLGSSMDALDVIENPVAPRTYIGVYHINVGGGRFALGLATSRDLRGWRKLGALDAGGGGMGTLRGLPGGGFLLAYEVQGPTEANRKVASNVRLRYYRDGAALISGRFTEENTLPRRLSPSNEGTPNFRGVTWRGSLSNSRILLGFHWLDHGPKLPVDRQGLATLDGGKWSVAKDAGVDRTLSKLGFHGNHGSRRQFTFPKGGKAWRIYEAQLRVNDTGSWRVFLYDVGARRLQRLQVRTPGGSRSFANPGASVLPSPAGGNALVVTMFIFGSGAGSGESGALAYYQDL